ncbi:hypothetical protein FQZ97_1233890 [compost metagenome]
MLNIFLKQILRDLCFDAEHELLTLFFRFNRFRRELRHIGHEADRGRDHILRCRIEHDARICPNSYATSLRSRQEEGHIDIADIDQIKHATTG